MAPGATVSLKAYCFGGAGVAPAVPFRVAGIAEFPFDAPDQSGAGTTSASLADACGTPEARAADLIMVTSAGDADAAASAIAVRRPDLRAFTNDQAVGQLQQRGFTYFRQISTVLTTITISFALLLITVLLTVSVNQRLGEVAALRALAPWLKQCHIKDGTRTSKAGTWGEEVVVGTGHVDWKAFFRALQELNYTGYLAIEREAGTQRLKDIGTAKDFVTALAI